MPVVVVTHNNTVGASIGADYLVYASKEIEESSAKYRLYSGHPTDSALTSLDVLIHTPSPLSKKTTGISTSTTSLKTTTLLMMTFEEQPRSQGFEKATTVLVYILSHPSLAKYITRRTPA